MKYYVVMCHRGHVGAGHSTEIRFAIVAENIVHACNIAKKMPSVKHHRFILTAQEITETRYNEMKTKSAYKKWR